MGILGDSNHQFTTSVPYKQLLVDVLQQYYPLAHQITLYEAPNVAIESMRITTVTLAEFVKTTTTQITTILIPPSAKMLKNEAIRARLAKLERISSAE